MTKNEPKTWWAKFWKWMLDPGYLDMNPFFEQLQAESGQAPAAVEPESLKFPLIRCAFCGGVSETLACPGCGARRPDHW